MRAADTAYPVEKHVASVSLVFDDEQNAYLRELSETMNLDFGEFIPHVTLINVTERDMPRLKAAAALPSLDKLVLDGVNFLPDEAGNCVWVELRVQKTSWMIEVRRKLLEMLDDIHPGLDIDGFRPHITIGCVEAGTLGDVDMSAIPRQLPVIIKPRAAACYNGMYGKVVEVVE
ncbi:hypothetical protein EUA67_04605 [TM7 phylum sp. oral taxon 352]|jgi:hypothetical protein|nr:hypothetical protein EUA67_04605 [TM7 phylum sp. oral taxon 352]